MKAEIEIMLQKIAHSIQFYDGNNINKHYFHI